jgi:Flp pilus assembly protein TadG
VAEIVPPAELREEEFALLTSTRERRQGVAAVELAVLLPLLVFLLMIAIDYARIFYYSLTIENCARNGAVFACNASNYQMPYSSIAQAAIADGTNLNPPLTTSNVTVANGTDANNNPTVTVTVNYTFQTITGYPGLPTTVNLARSVEMRVAPQ